jgi:hypothetical protein
MKNHRFFDHTVSDTMNLYALYTLDLFAIEMIDGTNDLLIRYCVLEVLEVPHNWISAGAAESTLE